MIGAIIISIYSQDYDLHHGAYRDIECDDLLIILSLGKLGGNRGLEDRNHNCGTINELSHTGSSPKR